MTEHNLDDFDIAATTSAGERAKGLLGRDSLDDDAGLYIAPCKQVHTFGMRFPIDVAFVGRHGEVRHVVHAMAPKRIGRIVLSAKGALELRAGRLAELDVAKGDRLIWGASR